MKRSRVVASRDCRPAAIRDGIRGSVIRGTGFLYTSRLLRSAFRSCRLVNVIAAVAAIGLRLVRERKL